MSLNEYFSPKGTELDALCLVVCQCSIQLVVQANKNVKNNYVVISAKAIHYASEINRKIDEMELALSQPKTGMSRLYQGVVFPKNAVRLRIRQKCKAAIDEQAKQLMLCTRIAVGVWPPPNAISDMLAASSLLAKNCKELVDLENTLGYFPLLDQALDFNFEDLDEKQPTSATSTMQNPSKIRYRNFNSL